MKFINNISDFEIDKVYYTNNNFIKLGGYSFDVLNIDQGLDLVEIVSIGLPSFFKIVNINNNYITTTEFSYIYSRAKYGASLKNSLILDFNLLKHYNIKILEVDNIRNFPFCYKDSDGFNIATEYNESDLLKYKLYELVKPGDKKRKK